ncbi:tryptophan-rich sensory protein [Enterococcus faecium EnGen0024]|uniref:Tryptophan-rich sensory protein n=2 Tax=Enterococcus faecium TaxID=1352 RepID=A0AAV3L4Y7_ENTFC|nr:tryptophan-rich sensory protein [Enterococcus faecium EnGen0024]ERT51911.1 tryptophan-rich sensory protein [Enterococcus faecium 10/96A]
MKMIKDIRFWVCVIGIVILGFLSGLLSGNPGEYYYSLQLPPFAPPSWIFGPMWTLLYILMGISLYLLLNHNNKKQRNNLVGLFVIQFIFNFIWSALFFNLLFVKLSETKLSIYVTQKNF